MDQQPSFSQHQSGRTVQARRQTTLTRVRFTPKWVWGILVLALALNAAMWGYIFWQFPPTDAVVFLHYTIYFGVDLTGSWWRILLMPITGLVVILLHSMVFLSRYSQYPVIPATAYALAASFQGIMLAATYFVILSNQSL